MAKKKEDVGGTYRLNPEANAMFKPGANKSTTGACPFCNKVFDPSRLNRHIEICKNSQNKRPKFDAGYHRVKGTNLEKYYKRKGPEPE